ncbi:hypothetical protein [Paraburkholderia sp. J7]|uniref:hypothetical protein n=1 Tax=Paraburkholderia sp. J7 TaxID=2805438 RepID=UPI002AB6F244|nr:hypothetical protein [Paraburkholderia sp. J7]
MKKFESIKQVIDGVAYNTRTSTHLGDSTQTAPPVDGGRPVAAVEQLYRTRGGRYFIAHREVPVWAPEGQKTVDEVEPVSKEKAIQWLSTHHPDSQELFIMSLPFVAPKPGVGTTISVRIDSNLKEGIAMRAALLGLPASSLHTIYLRHGFINHIERPLISPSKYRTEDDVALLNGDGEPAFDGIPDNGSEFELWRANVAAAFREEGHTIPQRLRGYLRAAIAGPADKTEANEEERIEMRNAALADIARWLGLSDEHPTWG